MKLFEKMRQQKLMSMALMLFTLSVGILIGTLINTQVNAARDQNAAPDATPLTVPRLSALGNDFTALAKKLEPSVVNITVDVAPSEKSSAHGQAPDDDSDVPDFFKRFFGPDGSGGGGGQDVPDSPKRQASGSGFIVDKNGYIVTNNHVVENATKIRVRLHGDPADYRGRLIGTDYETDLAVIKIDTGRPLQPVTIANSDSVQVGDWAVAIGSPFGLEATVTAGIVSAVGRSPALLNARTFQHFIQTDAAINPGNSGGPLLNIRGEVIGVNTMIATSGRGSEGVGFALPVNMVARAYNDIIRTGRVTRGSIGVSLDRSLEPEVTLKALGLDHGAIVEEIKPKGGPADKGGLRPGDIILGVNGTAVKDSDDLISRVADTPVGGTASLSVDRDGKPVTLKVIVADRAELYKDNPNIVGEGKPLETITSKIEAPAEVKFGFRPRPLTEQERDLVDSRRGVMVTLVEQDSFAEELGLQVGDVIDSINRQPVNSLEDIKKVQEKLKPGDAVAFHVVKGVAPPPPPATPSSGRGRNATVRAAAAQSPQGLYLSGILPGR
ncbi:MAG TPA: Do family serine endopeptidase [Bryobacteraceae bacterium]|jgi:serine protease Do|nr:Do family serine endopeptidase [Bryobacteraceae bacterium]